MGRSHCYAVTELVWASNPMAHRFQPLLPVANSFPSLEYPWRKTAQQNHVIGSATVSRRSLTSLFPGPVVELLAAQGVTKPFPIQKTLPDALAGRDIHGRGPDWIGKTLGFVLPLVTRSATRTRRSQSHRAPSSWLRLASSPIKSTPP